MTTLERLIDSFYVKYNVKYENSKNSQMLQAVCCKRLVSFNPIYTHASHKQQIYNVFCIINSIL